MTRGRPSARALIRALDRALDRGHTLDSYLDLARTLSSDLIGEDPFNRARRLDLDLDCTRALNRALDLARDLDHALTRALKRARRLDHARGLADGLELAHSRARDLARDLDGLDRAIYFDLGLVHNLANCLTRDLLGTRKYAESLVRMMDETAARDRSKQQQSLPLGTESRKGAPGRGVAPTARRLAAVAAWLLPGDKRARYGEEYRSELHDLAVGGAGRRQQLGYAIRLLAGALPLWVAVLAPRKGKASP